MLYVLVIKDPPVVDILFYNSAHSYEMFFLLHIYDYKDIRCPVFYSFLETIMKRCLCMIVLTILLLDLRNCFMNYDCYECDDCNTIYNCS